MAITNPLNQLPFGSEGPQFSVAWQIALNELFNQVASGPAETRIVLTTVSGTGYVLDTFSLLNQDGTRVGDKVVYEYVAKSGDNFKEGTLREAWSDAGALLPSHSQHDSVSDGDTYDLKFSFDFVGGRIRWLATSTKTYRISATRKII